MPKYVIERPLPGIGASGDDDMRGISEKSNAVLAEMGGDVQWLHSYVTDDKIYCVYLAPSEELIKEHARQGGFPANRISEVKSVIDPATAE